MKKIAFLIALLLMVVAPISGQDLRHFNNYLGANFSGIFQATISTDVAMVVQFTGEESYASVEVTAADGNLVFLVDGAADTSMDSGATCGAAGTIDVTDADCNTFAEVVDMINADDYWKAALIGALRTDDSTSTNGILITAAAAGAETGLSLLFDGTETDTVSQIITTKRAPRDYITAGQLVQNPYGGTVQLMPYLNWKTTHSGGGANTLTISCLERKYSGVTATETVTTMATITGAATTTQTVLDAADWGTVGFMGCRNGALHLRIVDAGAGNVTVAELSAYSVEFPSR